MAVGVPETDVFAAADAVLARGERPTVERVRLELGRGSPARVGGLLDQWWEQLAERLRGETRLPGLPAELAQAFVAIWQQATTLAQGVLDQSLESQRQVLAGEREQLAAMEARARLEEAQARQQTAEALAARQAAEIRLSDLEQLLTQRLTQIEDLRQQREQLLGLRDEARQQLVELRQQLLESQQQAEQTRLEQQRYTRDVEDRAFCEIDRAREESKGLAAQFKDAGSRLQAMQQTLLSGQTELADVREQRATAEAQGQAWREQLEQARQACVATSEQRDDLKRTLQRVEAELASTREQAAASLARTEVLSEQLDAYQSSLGEKSSRRSVKASPKTR
ncbi:MAG: DNA-binding protein [Pseudomonas gingeri]